MPPACKLAAPGRSHHTSLSAKHFEDVVIVPACGEAFVFDPDLVGCFVLEHDQSGLSEGAEVDIRMSFADSGMILSERHVQLPVELVLDRPVACHHLGKSLCRELLAQDVVPNVGALLAIPCRVADHHADGLEAGQRSRP